MFTKRNVNFCVRNYEMQPCGSSTQTIRDFKIEGLTAATFSPFNENG